jgi:hypothetical protein
METTKKNETAKSGKKLVTDEIVLSMLIDIHQKSLSNYLDYNDLREKYPSTIAHVLSVLRKREIIIKCGKSIVWQGDKPNIKMAISIRNEYLESARISSKKSNDNRRKLSEHKKHQESIKIAEEEQIRKDFNDVKVPLNFEVPLNAFQDLDTSTVHPALMPIEGYQKLQIDSFIRQTSQLQLEIESLKSKIVNKEEKKLIRLFGIKIGSIG